MTDNVPLYSFRFTVTSDDPDDDEYDTQDEFDRHGHRTVDIRGGEPDPADQLTAEEIADAHRWSAGVLARLTVQSYGDLVKLGRLHGCLNGDEYDARCGLNYHEQIYWQGDRDVGTYPFISYTVKREMAATVRDWLERLLGQMIAADQQPATQPATIEEQADEAHRRLQPHNPHQQQPTTSEEQA